MAQHWVNELRFLGRHDCMDNKMPNRAAKQVFHYFLCDFFAIAVKKIPNDFTEKVTGRCLFADKIISKF
jgi:hypothetical protein